MTIPNFLTLVRIILIPLLVILLLENQLGKALGVFVVAGITDALDGLIARMFHQKSKLGAYLDPLADKLLLVTTYLTLVHLSLLPIWLVVIVVSRDLFIVVGIMTFIIHGVKFEIQPSILSKITTVMQIITVILALSSPIFSFHNMLLYSSCVATAVVTTASGFHYLMTGIKIWEQSRADNDLDIKEDSQNC